MIDEVPTSQSYLELKIDCGERPSKLDSGIFTTILHDYQGKDFDLQWELQTRSTPRFRMRGEGARCSLRSSAHVTFGLAEETLYARENTNTTINHLPEYLVERLESVSAHMNKNCVTALNRELSAFGPEDSTDPAQSKRAHLAVLAHLEKLSVQYANVLYPLFGADYYVVRVQGEDESEYKVVFTNLHDDDFVMGDAVRGVGLTADEQADYGISNIEFLEDERGEYGVAIIDNEGHMLAMYLQEDERELLVPTKTWDRNPDLAKRVTQGLRDVGSAMPSGRENCLLEDAAAYMAKTIEEGQRN